MILPIGLLTIGAILMIAGFTNRSITQVINGEPSPDDKPEYSYDSDRAAVDAVKADLGTGGLPRAIARVTPVKVDGVSVAGWLSEIVAYAKMNGWNGRVTSGIRSDEAQRRACQNVCGNPNGCPGRCAKPGTSNHKGVIFPFGAIDVSDPSGFARAISTYPGGPPIKNSLGPADPVHFSRSGK